MHLKKHADMRLTMQLNRDPAKAKRELGWEAQYGIEEMCADSWRWQSQNPNGYAD